MAKRKGNTNAKRGAYFKGRTKKWLLKQGYQVADLEVVRWIYRPGGMPFPVKRDQFASDLLAIDGYSIVFVQVKGGEIARGQGQFPSAQRKFDEFTFPFHLCERWIVAWAPRSREPRIIKCEPSLLTAARRPEASTEPRSRKL